MLNEAQIETFERDGYLIVENVLSVDELATLGSAADAGPGEMASDLLRPKAVRIWHDQALYKEPGGCVTDPHQDRGVLGRTHARLL